MTLGTLYSDGPLCPFSHRVQIAAAELGAHLDLVYGPDIPAVVRQANQEGNWPVFVTASGGDMLRDSSLIVDRLIAHSGAAGEAYRSDGDTLAKLDSLVVCISKVIRAGKPAIQREFREKLDLALEEVDALRAAAGVLAEAKAPGILVGSRVCEADAVDELVAVAQRLGAPVVLPDALVDGVVEVVRGEFLEPPLKFGEHQPCQADVGQIQPINAVRQAYGRQVQRFAHGRIGQLNVLARHGSRRTRPRRTRSQTRSCWSSPPESSMVPSGVNASARTSSK